MSWLREPTRLAGLSRQRAWLALAALVLLLVASVALPRTAAPPPVSGDTAQRSDDQADVILYENIVAGVREGGNYYAVTARELRLGDYPLRPFVTFRQPTLALVSAALPDLAMIGLLYLLAAGVMYAWGLRLRAAFTRFPPLVIALILLAGGMVVFVQAELRVFHEVWAGLLIALALALRTPDRWLAAISVAMIAMLVRETAALFVIVMAALALLEGRRREFFGWCAILVAFAAVIAVHAWAVSQVVSPADPASPGWAGLLGWRFFITALSLSTAVRLAPDWIAALLIALSLFGWAAWRAPVALRAVAMFASYALLLSLFGRVDTFYWGLMVAPAILLGLAFVPDGLRDLIVSLRAPAPAPKLARIAP